jgi:hypothetical protein
MMNKETHYNWAIYDDAGKLRAEDWEHTKTAARRRAIEVAKSLIMREDRGRPVRWFLPNWRYTIWGTRGNALSGHFKQPCGKMPRR